MRFVRLPRDTKLPTRSGCFWCWKCRQQGHLAEWCELAYCHECGISGDCPRHRGKHDCPYLELTQQRRIALALEAQQHVITAENGMVASVEDGHIYNQYGCDLCGKIGHWREVCPYDIATCKYCWLSGHGVKDCVTAENEAWCLVCDREGHSTQNCRSRPR